MIHCIIVDDEPLARDLLEDNIKQVPFLKLIAKCRNAMEAIEIMQGLHVDLVFTDIQMPGLNGLQLIESMQSKPMFILITAYKNFALEGYKLDVVDYLLKPVSLERFILACNKAEERLKAKRLLGMLPQDSASAQHIFVPVDYKFVKVQLREVTHLMANKDYVKIYFSDTSKRPLMVRISMKAIEEMLPPAQFLRIHKSFIINIHFITAVQKNAVFINDQEFVVSEQYRSAIGKITKANSSN